MTGSQSVCPSCGSVVGDEALHRATHQAEASRARVRDGLTATLAAGKQWKGTPVPTLPDVPTDPTALTNADTLRARARKAVGTLRAYRALASPTTAQTVGVVRVLAGVAIGLAQLVLRETATIDPEEP